MWWEQSTYSSGGSSPTTTTVAPYFILMCCLLLVQTFYHHVCMYADKFIVYFLLCTQSDGSLLPCRVSGVLYAADSSVDNFVCDACSFEFVTVFGLAAG